MKNYISQENWHSESARINLLAHNSFHTAISAETAAENLNVLQE